MKALLFALSALSGRAAFAAQPADPRSLSSLIEYALEHSGDVASAAAETAVLGSAAGRAKRDLVIPQADLTAGYQLHSYDQPYAFGSGPSASNNGTNLAFGLALSYDLQKLFGPELGLAREGARLAKVQESVTRRDVVRSVKNGFHAIRELEAELKALQDQIALFDRIDRILEKQRSLGVYNELEREQFGVQKGLLAADASARRIEESAALFALSAVSRLPEEDLRARLASIRLEPAPRFAGRPAPPPSVAESAVESFVDSLSDGVIVEGLGRDYALAKLERDRFRTTPLPIVFQRTLREAPTMRSADGPQTTVEIGASLPLGAFFTRPAQKALLRSQADRSKALLDRSLAAYRSAVRANLAALAQLQAQAGPLDAMSARTKKLQDKSFLFYSQRRLDVLGTLDVFQKRLQALRLVFLNRQRIESVDADLEYLLGDAPASDGAAR